MPNGYQDQEPKESKGPLNLGSQVQGFGQPPPEPEIRDEDYQAPPSETKRPSNVEFDDVAISSREGLMAGPEDTEKKLPGDTETPEEAAGGEFDKLMDAWEKKDLGERPQAEARPMTPKIEFVSEKKEVSEESSETPEPKIETEKEPEMKEPVTEEESLEVKPKKQKVKKTPVESKEGIRSREERLARLKKLTGEKEETLEEEEVSSKEIKEGIGSSLTAEANEEDQGVNPEIPTI